MKKIHVLTPRHHEHLGKLGIPWLRPPHIMADEKEYQEAYQAWKETHPDAPPDFLHMKALGHIAWRQHATEQSRPVEVKQEKRKEWLLYAVIVLIVLLLCVPHAHCQFSKINFIDIKNQGSDIGFFTSPFTVNFTGAGVSCANSAGVVTCTVTGGSITNNPGGSTTNVQFNNGGTAFGGIANGTSGQVLISNGAGVTPSFQDPIVSYNYVNLWTAQDVTVTRTSPTVRVSTFGAYGSLLMTWASITGSPVGCTVQIKSADSAGNLINNGSALAVSPANGTTSQAFTPAATLPTGAQMAAVFACATTYPTTGTLTLDFVPSITTFVPNTVVISAASLPLPTGAALDSSLTTIDTDVKANITLHAGTNVIGHVIADTGSTTAVTGNVAVTKADGSDVTLGAKADAKSTATDTTAISAMSVLKQISASVQAPPSQAVTNAGTFAVQAATTIADGADTTLGAKGDAKSTATDTTAVSAISVLKEISALEQAPASRAVTNAGTFADQATLQTQTDTVMVGGVNVKEINGIAPLMGNGGTGTGSQRVTIASDNTAFAVNATLSAETTKVIGTVRAQGNLGAAFDAATGAAPPANAVLAGGLGSGATGGDVIAIPVGDTYKNINISTATTTLLVTGVASRQVRITALHMVTALANNVALIEGTGATCGTGTAGMAGGTTAASGYNLAANGGMTLGSGLGTVIATVTTGDSVCAVTSASTQLSGGIEYAIY